MPTRSPNALADKLSLRSKKNFYNVYESFDWNEPIPPNEFWLEPSLLSTYGTEIHESCGQARLRELSKWETINLFSVFCTGEADLIHEIASRMNHPGLEKYFDYLNHFIDEENKHMWFFRHFSLYYSGKTYEVKKMQFGNGSSDLMGDFMAFMKIVLFEEFGDLFNVAVIGSKMVPSVIVKIHTMHHKDEAGHILIGREICAILFARLSELNPMEAGKATNYLVKYLKYVLESMYNPQVYADAGFENPYEFRSQLMDHPARKRIHQEMISGILRHYPTIFREKML